MYDAIVVGARCAGSPTAMLLARKGYRVLLVDKAAFPSDITRGHYIHQPGIACLKRWGLLDQLVATNCPPIGKFAFDFGPEPIEPGVDWTSAATPGFFDPPGPVGQLTVVAQPTLLFHDLFTFER